MRRFRARAVPVAPGAERVYVESEWRGALVLVERGEVELQCVGGGSARLRRGDMLWFTGLPVRAVCNRGMEPAVLVTVSRIDEFRAPGRSQEP